MHFIVISITVCEFLSDEMIKYFYENFECETIENELPNIVKILRQRINIVIEKIHEKTK